MLAFAAAGQASAQTSPAPPGEAAPEQAPLTWTVSPTRTLRLFPAGDIYDVYVADQHRPTNVIADNFYSRIGIPESKSPRTTLAAGGRFGILRVESSAPRGRSWQFSLEAGLDGLFDSNYKNDGIGWDGNYGLTATSTTRGSKWAWRAAALHVSAHLGDEYEERTNTTRVNYTREEFAYGADWRPRRPWRVYGEVGIAYRMRSELQRRGRWQAGLEYERPPSVFGGRMAWYAASDLSSWQERDWRVDLALQGGLVTRSGGRAYRIYTQWYDGRVPLGQFFLDTEAALTFGFKIDL